MCSEPIFNSKDGLHPNQDTAKAGRIRAVAVRALGLSWWDVCSRGCGPYFAAASETASDRYRGPHMQGVLWLGLLEPSGQGGTLRGPGLPGAGLCCCWGSLVPESPFCSGECISCLEDRVFLLPDGVLLPGVLLEYLRDVGQRGRRNQGRGV